MCFTNNCYVLRSSNVLKHSIYVMERENEKKTHSGIQYDGNEEIYQKKKQKEKNNYRSANSNRCSCKTHRTNVENEC